MKKLLLATFFLIASYGITEAQQRQPVKRTQQPPAPREAPYVKKTDYTTDKEALEAKLKNIEALAGTLRSERDSARKTVAVQNARLDSIEQILSQTSLEAQLTSDSLSVTSFSLVQFMKHVDNEQNEMRAEINKIEKALILWLPLCGLFLLLLIGGGIWHNGRKTSALASNFNSTQQKMREQLSAQRDDLNERLTEIEHSLGSRVSAAESSLNRKISDTHSTLDLKLIEAKADLDNKIFGEVKASKQRFEDLGRELEDKVAELRSDISNRPDL